MKRPINQPIKGPHHRKHNTRLNLKFVILFFAFEDRQQMFIKITSKFHVVLITKHKVMAHSTHGF